VRSIQPQVSQIVPFRKFAILIPIIAAAAGGWFAGRFAYHYGNHQDGAAAGNRKILFYQSPMHPWIKSDQPGDCTICGMDLVPVYEGQKPFEVGDESLVTLDESNINVMHVETSTVTRQPLRRTLRVAGVIDDDDSRHRRLSAYIDGRIQKLIVNFVGAEVEAGQPLAHFYSPPLLTARDEYVLLARQPATAQRDSLMSAARERLLRMGLTPEQIAQLPQQKEPTNYIEILSPISGTVVEQKIYEGQYVKEGDVLFEIADFDQMWFVADIYERDLAWVRMGQRVEITTPSVPGKVYEAPITFIDPNLVAETRSAKVRVVLDNPRVGDPGKHRHELLHKTYAEGVIHTETPETLTVPRSAVLSPGGDPLVYVEKAAGVYEPRPVRLGRAGDTLWEVLDGLNEGESVVTAGNLLIDAQAQLNRSALGHEPPATVLPGAFTDEQREAAHAFLAVVSEVGEALASDNLDAFNATVPKLHDPAHKLEKAFGPLVARMVEYSRLKTAAEITPARQAFHALSMSAADFALEVRRKEKSLAEVKVFECPMVKEAVPSAQAREGRWMQMTGTIRNPFFGAEMLECGKELKR
jgi:Cu(I)/Ag(I) efflux system membrane fusion protein